MKDKDLEFEKLLVEYLPEDCKRGSVIDATILRKDMEYAFLDINNKLEGRIKAYEIEDSNIGDIVQVQVIRPEEDFIIVSKQALDRVRELDSYNEGDVVEGTVIKKIKGGYTVRVKSNNAFLPLSLADGKASDLMNKKLEFVIKEKTKRGLTVSRADFARKELNEFLDKLEVGETVKGIVKEVLDFGLVVDLGPTTGLIHISELSWVQIKDIRDLYKPGDEVEAKIIELNKEKAKIKLSVKQLTPNPWLTVRERYTIGEKRTGVIKEILEFGLVITIDETGDEGFMHISDISYRKFFKLDKSFKVGDHIEFIISNINDEKERISLSAKQILDELWDNIDDILREGDKVEATIIYMQNYGMFVELDNKLEAFVRRNEYAWSKDELPELNEGDKIEIMIIEINKEEKKISASIKELTTSPWQEASDEYVYGRTYNVEVTDKIESGYLVKLTDRFKGLIPLREADGDLNVGDSVEVIVLDTNENKNSIILSSRRVKENEEKAEMQELMKKYGADE